MRTTILILAVGLMVGCTSAPPDAMPDDAMRVLETSPKVVSPDAAMAKRSGVPLDRLGNGYAVFLRKCSECHEPRVAVNPKDPSWHPILKGMGWNAGLSDSEAADMEAYLLAAAKSL